MSNAAVLFRKLANPSERRLSATHYTTLRMDLLIYRKTGRMPIYHLYDINNRKFRILMSDLDAHLCNSEIASWGQIPMLLIILSRERIHFFHNLPNKNPASGYVCLKTWMHQKCRNPTHFMTYARRKIWFYPLSNFNFLNC